MRLPRGRSRVAGTPWRRARPPPVRANRRLASRRREHRRRRAARARRPAGCGAAPGQARRNGERRRGPCAAGTALLRRPGSPARWSRRWLAPTSRSTRSGCSASGRADAAPGLRLGHLPPVQRGLRRSRRRGGRDADPARARHGRQPLDLHAAAPRAACAAASAACATINYSILTGDVRAAAAPAGRGGRAHRRRDRLRADPRHRPQHGRPHRPLLRDAARRRRARAHPRHARHPAPRAPTSPTRGTAR